MDVYSSLYNGEQQKYIYEQFRACCSHLTKHIMIPFVVSAER